MLPWNLLHISLGNELSPGLYHAISMTIVVFYQLDHQEQTSVNSNNSIYIQ